jgi:hypothetical protein
MIQQLPQSLRGQSVMKGAWSFFAVRSSIEDFPCLYLGGFFLYFPFQTARAR